MLLTEMPLVRLSALEGGGTGDGHPFGCGEVRVLNCCGSTPSGHGAKPEKYKGVNISMQEAEVTSPKNKNGKIVYKISQAIGLPMIANARPSEAEIEK